MNVSATSNPAGGQDINVVASKQFDSNSCNATVGGFAGGNSLGGSPHAGVFANANANGHGVSYSKTILPGVATTTAHGVNTNLFKNDSHSVNAHAFSNNTKLSNGFAFKTHGGGLDYNNALGHGASVGVNKIPGFGTSMDVGAKANLFQSPNSAFDVMANSKTHLSGPFRGKSNFGASAVFSQRF